jgi:hypothetical protein
MEQQDTVGSRHFNPTPKAPQLFELVKVETTGYSQRDTVITEVSQGVYSTELGAYKAGIKSGYKVRPLKVND